MSSSPVKILVTGATGFIGSRLVRALKIAGHNVSAIVRQPAPELEVETFYYSGHLDEMQSAFRRFAPDCVVHLASLFLASHQPEDVTRLFDANVLFGAYLLESMTAHGCRKLVSIGTSWQHYGGTDRYEPVSLYAATKQAFEDIVAFYASAHELRSIILKLSDTYGPHDTRGKLVSALIKATHTGDALKLSPGAQVINMVHVDDVVRAICIALDRSVAYMETYSVRGVEDLTLLEFVGLCSRTFGREVPVEFGARPYRAREVMIPWKGVLLPGWTPEVSLEQGLRQVYDTV